MVVKSFVINLNAVVQGRTRKRSRLCGFDAMLNGVCVLKSRRSALLTVIIWMIAALPTPAYAQGEDGTTIRLGGILTQFLFVADDAEAPAEKINPTGQFHYSRIFADARTNLSDSVYVRAYTRIVVNNWSSVNAEQSYVEVGGPYGHMQVGVRNPYNELVIRYPAPQAFLAVGDEIFSSMVKARTGIPQRDGLTFKRHVGRDIGVSYQTPRIAGLQVGIGYRPSLAQSEGSVDKSKQPSNAVDVTLSHQTSVLGGTLHLVGGYFRVTAPPSDPRVVEAWNTAMQWRTEKWEVGGAFHDARLNNGVREAAWAIGVLHRTGPWAFSTDFRSSSNKAAKGAPVGEYADRIMVQTQYRLGPGINIGIAGFYSLQSDINKVKWRSKGATVGIKLIL